MIYEKGPYGSFFDFFANFLYNIIQRGEKNGK